MHNYKQSSGLFKALCSCERGATSIEYALIASLISMSILGGAALIGQSLKGTFEQVGSNLD